jgi:hypothetical protein
MAPTQSSSHLDLHNEAVRPGLDEAFIGPVGEEISFHLSINYAFAIKHIS